MRVRFKRVAAAARLVCRPRVETLENRTVLDASVVSEGLVPPLPMPDLASVQAALAAGSHQGYSQTRGNGGSLTLAVMNGSHPVIDDPARPPSLFHPDESAVFTLVAHHGH